MGSIKAIKAKWINKKTRIANFDTIKNVHCIYFRDPMAGSASETTSLTLGQPKFVTSADALYSRAPRKNIVLQ